MRSVAVAEWVLARYAEKQRASAMMGDLLEQRERKGAWWFWRAYAGVLLAAAWRPLLAFVAAVFAAAQAWNWLMNRQIGIWQTPVLQAELLVTTFLGVSGWFVTVYSGVRYGVRDVLTQLAAVIALLSSTAMLFCRDERALLGWGGAALVVIVASAVIQKTRRVAIPFVVTSAAWSIAFLLMAFVGSMYTRYALHLRLLGDKELRDHPSIGYVDAAVLLIGEAVAAWLCKEMHRRLIEQRRTEPA